MLNERPLPRILGPKIDSLLAISIAFFIVEIAAGYSERIYTYPNVAPTAIAAITIPSIRVNGSPSIRIRSAKVPLSPSSALQQIYF